MGKDVEYVLIRRERERYVVSGVMKGFMELGLFATRAGGIYFAGDAGRDRFRLYVGREGEDRLRAVKIRKQFLLDGLARLVFSDNGEEEWEIVIPSFWWQKHFGGKPHIVSETGETELFPVDCKTEGNFVESSDSAKYILKSRR